MRSHKIATLSRQFVFRRWNSTAAVLDLPVRHSLKQPPRICSDPVERLEQTQKLLETPVGKLYATKATAEGGLEEAYDVAYESIKAAEYLQLGHASQIPGSLYSSDDTTLNEENPLETMQQILSRMQEEGDMYMALRQEKKKASNYKEAESQDSEYLEGEDSISVNVPDFAAPGPTSKLAETLLDGMACMGGFTPAEFYKMATNILDANDLDKGSNLHTLPTQVTYNAALRGIAGYEPSSDIARDEVISHAFTLYNHLTHSLHIPRNDMTFVYMLQILDKSFPTSRVKGNMSVTLWAQASQLGVVSQGVIEALKQVHEPSNGPEFNILLDEISGNLPQKYRRFVNKYSHSKNY